MTEPAAPTWDLDALDQAANRERLWRWFPLVVLGSTVAGYLGLMGLGAVAVYTRDLRWMVPGVVSAFLPLAVGIGVRTWRQRAKRRTLPGERPGWARVVLLPLLLVALFGGAVMANTLDRVDTVVVSIALVTTLALIPTGHLLRPQGEWFPPRWTGTAVLSASALCLAATLALVLFAHPPVPVGVALTAVILLGPGLSMLLFARGVEKLRAAGDHDAAVSALSHWRMTAFSTSIRARILMHAGHLSEAQTLCETFARQSLQGEWHAVLALAARLALTRGDRDAAVAHTKTLLAIAPHLPHGYILAAELALPDGELAAALLERATLHYERTRPTAAFAAALRADEARLAVLQGRVHLASGRVESAEEQLDRALACIDGDDRPTSAVSLHRAAVLADQLGRDGEALRSRAAALDPRGVGAKLAGVSADAE